MLEPDVTLTDLILAIQCAVFSWILFRSENGPSHIGRLFAWLFAALGVSSLLGGIWHGAFSSSDTAAGQGIWFLTMAALAMAAASLWLISSTLLASGTWSRVTRGIAFVQLILQLSVSAFVTDSFAVATVGLLPPLVTVFTLCVIQTRQSGATGAVQGAFGFALAGLAGLIILFDVSLHPEWASTLAVYHMVQVVAFWLVFRSIPALSLTIEGQIRGRA